MKQYKFIFMKYTFNFEGCGNSSHFLPYLLKVECIGPRLDVWEYSRGAYLRKLDHKIFDECQITTVFVHKTFKLYMRYL